MNFVETDLTNPGSTSQQEDLRDIEERAARDHRRVSLNAAKISTREAVTQNRD